MKPTLNGRYLFAEKELTLGDPLTNPESRKATLRFQAEDIRKERTGVHARVHIMVNNISVAWDQFNVERHGDRRALVNHAYKGFGSNPPFGYATDVMLFDFGEFCEYLWIESLNIHQAEELAGDPNLEQRFLCSPFVLEGAGTILFAPGGKGKSYTALLLAVCIDAGIDIFWPVEIAKVMYINLERSRASMQRRLGMVNRALGLDESRPLLFFNGRGQSLSDISEHLSAEIEKKHVEVIFLDSISRTGQGNLNENQIANRISDTLNSLCPTWLGIAHTPRADEKHIFGSAHFENAADMTIRLHSVQEETQLGVGLEITKANDTPWQPMNLIGFDFTPEGLEKVWPATESDFPELATEQKRTLAQDIIAFFKNESPNATTGELAKALNRNRTTISTILTSDQRFVVVRTDRRMKYYGLRSSDSEGQGTYEV